MSSWGDWSIGSLRNNLSLDVSSVIGGDDLNRLNKVKTSQKLYSYLFLGTSSKNVALSLNDWTFGGSIPSPSSRETNN